MCLMMSGTHRRTYRVRIYTLQGDALDGIINVVSVNCLNLSHFETPEVHLRGDMLSLPTDVIMRPSESSDQHEESPPVVPPIYCCPKEEQTV